MDITELRLPDQAFWTAGERSMDPVVRKHKGSYFGMFLDAPREVDLGTRKTLPAFAYYMGQFSEVATRDFDKQALIVAVEPDRNELLVSMAVESDGEAVPEPPQERGPMPPGSTATAAELELRETLGLAWQPQQLLLQLIMQDMVSNRIETRLVRSRTQYADPEVEKFLAAERAKKDPEAPSRNYPQVRRGIRCMKGPRHHRQCPRSSALPLRASV